MLKSRTAITCLLVFNLLLFFKPVYAQHHHDNLLSDEELNNRNIIIVSDDFIDRYLSFEFNSVKEIEDEIKGRTKVLKRAVKNRHYPEQIDTIFTINARKTTVKVYKTSDKMILFDAFQRSKRNALSENIKPKMKKEELVNYFNNEIHLKSEWDNVVLTDELNTFIWQFIFNRRNKIISMHYTAELF